MNLTSPMFHLPQGCDPVKFNDPGQELRLRSEDTVFWMDLHLWIAHEGHGWETLDLI